MPTAQTGIRWVTIRLESNTQRVVRRIRAARAPAR